MSVSSSSAFPVSSRLYSSSGDSNSSSVLSTPLSDSDLTRAMLSAPVQQALALGIDASRVHMALRHRHRQTGAASFSTVNEVVQAAFGVQHNQERRVSAENSESPSAFSRPRSLRDVARVEDEELAATTTPTATTATEEESSSSATESQPEDTVTMVSTEQESHTFQLKC